MEHLATLDAAFFALEDQHSTLQIASLAIFAGPPLDAHDLTMLFRRKLHLVPRLRQMLRPVPFDLARPAWVDDTDFDLDNHLQYAHLPAPGDRRALEQLMGELLATPLDPKRPLWQVWLVDGLGGEWAGHWALITKLHHSMLDGIGGMALLSRIYDRSEDARLPAPDRWIAAPQPSTIALLGSAMRVQVNEVAHAVRGAVRASVRPRSALHEVRLLASGLSEFRSGLARTAPSPLTGPLGTARAYATGSIALADLEAVRAALGGTLNDVVLALVTAAQRDVIVGRHQATQPHQVQCLVPVSLRPRGLVDPVGNKVSALIIDLPVDFADPLTRYQALLARVRHAKRTHEAETGADLQTALDALPAMVVTPAIRAAARAPQHFLTTVATNVPGPGRTLYALGRPLVEHYPYVPIADRLRTGFAVTSYGDRLFYGVTADRDSISDISAVSAAIEREVAVLTGLARGHEEST